MNSYNLLTFLLLVVLWMIQGLDESYISNHSFVFISGWPQSGTSLAHQILSYHSDFSTMIQKCEDILGNKCIGWNHEGQWILRGKTRKHFSSGRVIALDNQEPIHPVLRNISLEWGSFWNLDKPYLVEKSPQSLLKLKLLSSIFTQAKSTKFLIILKHPVTLNIATPRHCDWKFYRDQPGSLLKDPNEPKKRITNQQKIENFQYFYQFMMGSDNNQTILNSPNQRKEESLAWIPAMKTLHQLLSNYPQSKEQVRIIRYEEFIQPIKLCENIFFFLYDIPMRSTNITMGIESFQQYCKSLFTKKRVSSPSIPQVFEPNPSRRAPPYPRSSSSHRQLRFRTIPGIESFVFRPELVTLTSLDRINAFSSVYKNMPKNIQLQIQEINNELQSFGYNLFQLYPFPQKPKSLFDDWEFHYP